MSDVEKRFDAVEGRLGSLSKEVGELRGEVQQLRVLGEDNARQITLILDVQHVHSVRLDRITKQLEPLEEMRRTLGSLHDFVRAVAHDHELRIPDLERRAGGPRTSS